MRGEDKTRLEDGGEDEAARQGCGGLVCSLLQIVQLCAEARQASRGVAGNYQGATAASVSEGAKSGRDFSERQIILDCLLAALRVLVNLSHHNTRACIAIGDARGIEGTLECLLTFSCAPSHDEWLSHEPGPGHEHSFDAQLLALTLLTNCVEINRDNCNRLARALVITDELGTLPRRRRIVITQAEAQGAANTCQDETSGSRERG